MARILYTSGTGSTQTTNQSETYKLPIYDSEQDAIDDLANLEVGDLVATDDPSESETIATLIAKIQELEENANKYYEPSINWQNSNGITTVTLTFDEALPAGLYEIYLGGSIIYHTTTNFHTCNGTPYGATMKVNTDGASYTGCTGVWKANASFSTLVIQGYATQGSSDSGSNNKPSAGTEMCYVKKIGE